MRIWSLHPKHLDTKGLVALWRETLLAKNVMEGKTKGYRNHPQLIRFKAAPKPLNAIHFYLQQIWIEASSRNYNFDKSKFTEIEEVEKIPVTTKQVEYERNHLQQKLQVRDKEKHQELLLLSKLETHPLFELIEGEFEEWEKVVN